MAIASRVYRNKKDQVKVSVSMSYEEAKEIAKGKGTAYDELLKQFKDLKA